MKRYNLIIRLTAIFIGCFSLGCLAADRCVDGAEDGTVVFDNQTKGGLNGRVIKVTNLNAEGEGSLRAAIEADGARVVVFEVGGVIDLEMDNLSIRNPYITIAGQTAPTPGITIIKGGIYISAHDVVIKHIAVRPGDAGQAKKSGWEPDGISSYGENVHHLWVDHCSLTWAVDENLSASGPRYIGRGHTSNHVTFSNNIIAEGLNNSSHAKGPHSKGTLIHDNCTEIAIVGNLYANNADRNPYLKSNTIGIIVNNLIYNPGKAAIKLSYGGEEWAHIEKQPDKPLVSIVGNVYYRGQDTQNDLPMVKSEGNVYLKDNQAYDSQLKEASQAAGNIVLINQSPVWLKGLEALSSKETESSVLQNAGSRPAERDPIDQRIILGVKNKNGKIIDSQEEVGGYPEREATYRKLDIPDESLERWLEEFAVKVEKGL